MAKVKNYKDYLYDNICRCGKKLEALKHNPEKYKIALSNLKRAKRRMKKKGTKAVDNTIDLPGSVLNSIYTHTIDR